MLGLKLNHVSKRGPSALAMVLLHSQLHQAIEKCRLHNEQDRETWCIMTISVMCSWISHIWFWTKCRILQQFSSQFSISFQFQSFVFGHLYLIVQSVVGLALNRRRSFAEHKDIPAHWRIHASLCTDMMFQHIEKGYQRILFQPYYYITITSIMIISEKMWTYIAGVFVDIFTPWATTSLHGATLGI